MSQPGESPTVRAERAGRLLTITLDRPAQANALDMSTACQLRDAVRLIDDSVGCVLLRAEGANFCVGGDIRAFAAAPEPGKFLGELASVVHDAVLGLAEGPAPVVAAVNGWAAGAGMCLAACADITLAAESARFRSAYSAIGLSPRLRPDLDAAPPGRPRAGSRPDAHQPAGRRRGGREHRPGRPGSGRRLAARRGAGARRRAGVRPGRGLRPDQEAARRRATGPPSPEQLDAEAASIAACADDPEGRAGVAAFTAGRTPVFH